MKPERKGYSANVSNLALTSPLSWYLISRRRARNGRGRAILIATVPTSITKRVAPQANCIRIHSPLVKVARRYFCLMLFIHECSMCVNGAYLVQLVDT